jgi:hypothetical protein
VAPALRVSWYRLHGTFSRRWGGYLALAVVIGLLGGLAMGAIAAGGRTDSSFDEFAQNTNASDLVSGVSIYNPAIGVTSGYSAQLIRQIAKLPMYATSEAKSDSPFSHSDPTVCPCRVRIRSPTAA